MKRKVGMIAAVVAISMIVTACGSQRADDNTAGNEAKLSGEIRIDGSSTVYPITAAMAEEFMIQNRDVKISVGISGSSGGFKKWVKGELDVNDSSRKIRDKEIKAAEEQGFGYVEIPVAYDGITVVVNPNNEWLNCITKEQLRMIWDEGSTVKKWSDVDPSWPDEEIKLYGPGTDSGTMEYFTDHINGEPYRSRSDYTASEDDNVLVTGVAGNENAMGYFGYAYYLENQDKVKALAIDGGNGCVEPNDETIAALEYPIAREIYIYPTMKALERPEVFEFVKFYLENAHEIVPQVGYTSLGEEKYAELLKMVEEVVK